MLGIGFLKTEPTQYVLHYSRGRLAKEGAGLSVLYFEPTDTIVVVPLNTTDQPFAFQEVTSDFQAVTLQGQLSYRVVEPKKLAALLDYSVDRAGGHASEDPMKLSERLLLCAQSVMHGLVGALDLRQTLTGAAGLAERGLAQLKASELVASHGIEVLAFSLVSLRPTPETAKALEAAAREALLRESDQAIYARRKAAVEEERKVKETELDTERAVEEKRRRVREAHMEAEIAVEEQRSSLLAKRVDNDRKETESRAYAIERTLAPFKEVDWKMLLALGGGGTDGRMLMAHAFERFAENADKIGQLNITPDLFGALLAAKK